MLDVVGRSTKRLKNKYITHLRSILDVPSQCTWLMICNNVQWKQSTKVGRQTEFHAKDLWSPRLCFRPRSPSSSSLELDHDRSRHNNTFVARRVTSRPSRSSSILFLAVPPDRVCLRTSE